MNIRNLLIATTVAALPAIACAEEKDSTPPEIPISIDFQSPAVALAVESVQIFAFKDSTLDCQGLIEARATRTLPPGAIETRALSPCDLFNNNGNTMSLDLKAAYTTLAVAQIGGNDVLVGCTAQPPYGSTQAVEITLSFVDEKQTIPAPKCSKLSDKCNGNPCQ